MSADEDCDDCGLDAGPPLKRDVWFEVRPWEYKTVFEPDEDTLNKLGAGGWEAVAAMGRMVIFKRAQAHSWLIQGLQVRVDPPQVDDGKKENKNEGETQTSRADPKRG